MTRRRLLTKLTVVGVAVACILVATATAYNGSAYCSNCKCGDDCKCGDTCKCDETCKCAGECECGDNCTCGDKCVCRI